MNKEKEIEEVRDIIARIVVGHEKEVWGIEAAARQIIARAGYRKADEVRKETLKEVYKQLIDNLYWGRITDEKIDEIFKEKYGIEID